MHVCILIACMHFDCMKAFVGEKERKQNDFGRGLHPC
jgi:hypothetical protein